MRDNPKTKPNHIFTIVCIAIVFFLTGIIGLVIIHGNHLLRLLENNLVAMVELEEDLSVSEIQLVQEELKSNVAIQAGSVQYVSKKEALTMMEQELNNEIATTGENPFFNSFTFKIEPKQRNQSNIEQLSADLIAKSGILNFHFPERIAHKFSAFIRTFIWVSIVIAILFLLLGIYLIINTIKLSLYANRFLIKNMQIVGAPWQFIRRPFIRSGLINGLISSFIALAVLIAVIFFARSQSLQFKQIFDIGSTGLLLFFLLIACLLTCWMSTKIGVNYYLKQKLENLY